LEQGLLLACPSCTWQLVHSDEKEDARVLNGVSYTISILYTGRTIKGSVFCVTEMDYFGCVNAN